MGCRRDRAEPGPSASNVLSTSAFSQVPPSRAALTAQITCSTEALLGRKPTAPARIASIAVAVSAYAVSTTTAGGDGNAVSRLVRSIPLARPMRTSMITVSGVQAVTAGSTWSERLTVMGSKSGSVAKTASRPWQKTRWSSTMTRFALISR